MSFRCNGINSTGGYCKIRVSNKNDYCYHHRDQKLRINKCKCILDNGSNCPYDAEKDEVCEYHQNHSYCQGNTLLGEKCMKIIASGNYCCNCKSQEGIILDKVKTSADEFRGYLSRKGEIVIPQKKATVFRMKDKVKIPESFRKVELEKPDSCCICLEKLDSKYRSLKCGHYFHDVCISGVDKFACPLCRAEIDSQCIPKWIQLRIQDNIIEAEKKRIEENRLAAERMLEDAERLLDIRPISTHG